MEKTPLYQEHILFKAKLASFGGYMMPIRYTSEKEEHLAVKHKVGIFDISHMGEFFVEGKDAKSYLQHIQTNDISKLYPGKALYTCITNRKGGVIDDLLIYSFDENKYMLVVNASNIEKDWAWLNEHKETYNLTLKNCSNQIALLAVQGPLAEKLLTRLTEEPIEELSNYHFLKGKIAGLEEVIISKTGYTGCGGYELYTSNDQAKILWQTILDKGQDLGIQPAGLAARNTLRIEAGYCLYGNELTDDISPLEAGLAWITKLNTSFVGSDIVKAQKEQGLSRKLIALEMIDRAIPRKDCLIKNTEDKVIGKVTSGTLSPVLQKGIGLGYVQKPFVKLQDRVFVVIRGKNFRAEIIRLPKK